VSAGRRAGRGWRERSRSNPARRARPNAWHTATGRRPRGGRRCSGPARALRLRGQSAAISSPGGGQGTAAAPWGPIGGLGSRCHTVQWTASSPSTGAVLAAAAAASRAATAAAPRDRLATARPAARARLWGGGRPRRRLLRHGQAKRAHERAGRLPRLVARGVLLLLRRRHRWRRRPARDVNWDDSVQNLIFLALPETKQRTLAMDAGQQLGPFMGNKTMVAKLLYTFFLQSS
jgi:hypothetical protein